MYNSRNGGSIGKMRNVHVGDMTETKEGHTEQNARK